MQFTNNMSVSSLAKVSILSIFILSSFVALAQNKAVPIKRIDTQRVKEIELLLVEKPAGYGDPCNRRDVWDKLLNSGAYDKFLKETESFSFPKFSKEDYFSLSDGSAPSSARGLEMMRYRAKGLSRFTWAECLENKDRYTQKVADGLRELLNQSSWVSPRSDIDFKNYKDISYTVELTSALYAHTFAQTLYLMGNKIDPKLRQDAMDALYLKIFNPVINSIQTKNTEESKFLVMTNNWNHVCLSGVVGAALTVIEDKTERAIFSWIGEYYSQNGLVSFEDDGYCSEGIGYFNYGIGHFIMLRENIWQATNGRVDLLSDDKIKKIALYVPNIEIINGIYPPFSDSSFKNKPDSSIVSYLSRNLSVGLLEYDTLTFIGKTTDIRNNIMMAFPNSASLAKPNRSDENKVDNLRSFFAQSGVLVSRPMPNSPCRMGVALKGGHNDENHNHNDLGSYSVVLGREMMAGDPGRIPYTSDIFNNKYRYTYKSIGSMGHPVPLIAGQ